MMGEEVFLFFSAFRDVINTLNLLSYLHCFVTRLVMGLHWWVEMKCMPARIPGGGGRLWIC